jgi:hypothetical protein
MKRVPHTDSSTPTHLCRNECLSFLDVVFYLGPLTRTFLVSGCMSVVRREVTRTYVFQ